jgi:hypothetical protein
MLRISAIFEFLFLAGLRPYASRRLGDLGVPRPDLVRGQCRDLDVAKRRQNECIRRVLGSAIAPAK